MSIQTFKLLILGSSAATPTSTRNPTAQLLNIAERFFLIDCGEATQIQLRKYKARVQSINHIFISHLHGDHFLDLPVYWPVCIYWDVKTPLLFMLQPN